MAMKRCMSLLLASIFLYVDGTTPDVHKPGDFLGLNAATTEEAAHGRRQDSSQLRQTIDPVGVLHHLRAAPSGGSTGSKLHVKDKVAGCPVLIWMLIYTNSSFLAMGSFLLCLCWVAPRGQCSACCVFGSAVVLVNLLFALLGHLNGWTLSEVHNRLHHWCLIPAILPWILAVMVILWIIGVTILHADREYSIPEEASNLAASLFEQNLNPEKYLDSDAFKHRCDRFFDSGDADHDGNLNNTELEAVLLSVLPTPRRMQSEADSCLQAFNKKNEPMTDREEFYQMIKYLECKATESGYGQAANTPECAVCFIPYNLVSRMPQTLKCDHTFCDACVSQLFQPHGLPCPICRELSLQEDVRVDDALRESLAAVVQTCPPRSTADDKLIAT